MTGLRYPWKRYWQKMGAKPLAPAAGYLPEFDDETSRFIHPDYRTLAELENVQCLILLGEPGLGKSTALQDDVARSQMSGQRIFAYDLKDYGDASHLVQNIFEGPAFRSDIAPIDVTLVLDSLDEGQIAISNIASVLGHELRTRLRNSESRSRFHFRISSRSVEWPASLTATLREVFGEENVELWHLMQLRKSDVKIAAELVEIDAQSLLQEIDAREAEPLAIKPVTLELLLQLKAHRGALPSSQVDLYRQGLEVLCAEPNAQRQELGTEQSVGRLSAAERLRTARHIAGLSVLCARPFIALADRPDTNGDGSLTTSAICGDNTETESGRAGITAGGVRETVRTGLFRRSGASQVAWMHSTYAEFLAADYLFSTRFDPPQIDALLRTADGRIVPQLRETASWLASLDEVFRKNLLITDPEVLLRSDLVQADDDLKAELAENLLSAIESRTLNEDTLERYYERLASRQLTEVLRRRLEKSENHNLGTVAALKMSRACRIEGLNSVLVAISTDETRSSYVRKLAVEALGQVASTSDRAALRPLLEASDDELQVAVIRMLWPKDINSEEMLRTLHVPRDNIIGSYDYFVGHDLLDELPPADLPTALLWMADFIQRHPSPNRSLERIRSSDSYYNFRRLFERLYAKAVENAENEKTAAALVEAAVALLGAHDWLWETSMRSSGYKRVPEDIDMRRSIAVKLMARLAATGGEVFAVIWELPYVGKGDFDWLLDLMKSETDPAFRHTITDALMIIYDKSSSHQFEKLYTAGDIHPELAEMRSRLSGYMEFSSPEVRFLRGEGRKIHQALPERSSTPDNVRRTISELLAKLKEGKYEKWWNLLRYLSFENGMPSEGVYKSGLDSLPRCQYLNSSPGELAEYAKFFLISYELKLDSWWPEKGVFFWPAWAGYRAFDYLLDADAKALEQLPCSIWSKWAPALINLHMNDEDRFERGGTLSSMCLKFAPDAFRWRLREKLIALANSNDRRISFRWHLKGVWDPAIGDLVAELVTREDAHPQNLREGLWLLLDHGHQAGTEILQATILGTTPAERRPEIVSIALRQGGGLRWKELWPILEADRDLGFKSLALAADGDFLKEMAALTEDDLAELYLFLCDPHEEGDVDTEVTTPYHELIWMRDRIPRLLSERATDQCYAALVKIRDSNEKFAWISHYIVECRDNMRRASWQAPSPAELRRMSASRERRLVRSETELIEVLMASINRFQQRLFGIQPAIGDLWNTVPGAYRPKEENELSDVIVRFLRDDLDGHGLVVNREVEIRPARGGAPGSRTDIQVDAIAPGDRTDVVRAVIEVKGCWHPQLKTAMQSQLVGSYLGGSSIGAGIYLVVWFLCPAWVDQDKRKLATMRLGWTVDAASGFFVDQATNLGVGGLVLRSVVIDAQWQGSPKPKPREGSPKS